MFLKVATFENIDYFVGKKLLVIEIKKEFPSGVYVMRCWDVKREEIDFKLVKDWVETFVDTTREVGTVCVIFKNEMMVAFMHLRTEEDYMFNMELSLSLENYEEAFLIEQFWTKYRGKCNDAK